MRTESEVKARIANLKGTMTLSTRQFYTDEMSDNVFKEVYSAIWEEMTALYWFLGDSRDEAVNKVAQFMVTVGFEVKKLIDEAD